MTFQLARCGFLLFISLKKEAYGHAEETVFPSYWDLRNDVKM